MIVKLVEREPLKMHVRFKLEDTDKKFSGCFPKLYL